ncbi:MAG: hypothetical protein LBU35_03710 [Holosporales bacterium]|jgi:hypothetical protein|nr:hypothetical protein [Holosporales bacterium]
MKVKCPYCGCIYNITPELLNAPIGNEKLGYGWWLRCYKCQKKWWLKNIDIAAQIDTPLIADKKAKIEKISRLSNKKSLSNRKKSRWVKYALLILVIIVAIGAYYKKDLFYEYITNKAKRLSESIIPKLTMKDVRYTLTPMEENNKYRVTVSGEIINEDKTVAKFKGIEFFVYDSQNNEIKSWTKNFDTDFVLSGDGLDFSSEEIIENLNGNIKVDVAILGAG